MALRGCLGLWMHDAEMLIVHGLFLRFEDCCSVTTPHHPPHLQSVRLVAMIYSVLAIWLDRGASVHS